MADDPEPEAPFDFRPFLEPFERVMWQGRPVPTGGPNPLTRAFLVVAILSTAGIGSVFVGADDPDRFGAIFIAGAMIAVLGWVLVTMGPEDRKLRRSVHFAVTDRRVLRGDARESGVMGRDLADIRAVEVHGDDSIATVRFRVAGDERAVAEDWYAPQPLQSRFPAFVDIANASAVAALVERLRAKPPPASRERNPRVAFWEVVEPTGVGP